MIPGVRRDSPRAVEGNGPYPAFFLMREPQRNEGRAFDSLTDVNQLLPEINLFTIIPLPSAVSARYADRIFNFCHERSQDPLL